MARYALGLDYGTESARALLVDVADGREAGTAVAAYPDGVIDRQLPGSGVALGPDWALQNPRDYLTALESIVPAALHEAGAAAEDVVGIGIDFTSCTLLPARAGAPPPAPPPGVAGGAARRGEAVKTPRRAAGSRANQRGRRRARRAVP